MRKAEEDLRARQQVLHLYGKALDKVADTLPEESRDQAPHPHAVKQLLAKAGPVTSLWATKTGYAAAVKGSTDSFLDRAQEAVRRIGAQARAATPTYGYVVSRVPTTLRDLSDGFTTGTEAMLAEEAAMATKKKVSPLP